MQSKKYFELIANVAILILIFSRLLVVKNDVSFDRIFYIEFIEELSRLNIFDFFERLFESFPYFSWADYGAFESGFSVFAYAVALVVSPSVAWAVIAIFSLALKLIFLIKSDVNYLKIYLGLVFSIILFETNALRAGVAVAILMTAIFFLIRDKVFIPVSLLFFASLFHLSSIIIIFLIIFGILIKESKLIILYVMIAIVSSALFVLTLPFIGQFVGGKLHDYYIQSHEFGLYTGASGLNMASFICLLFFVKFATLHRAFGIGNKKLITGEFHAVLGCLISGVCASMLLFSGPFAIVADRIWQMVLLPLLMLESYGNRTADNSISGKIFNYIIVSFLLFYVVGNLMFRYPQSNFFVPIVPMVELTPPTVY